MFEKRTGKGKTFYKNDITFLRKPYMNIVSRRLRATKETASVKLAHVPHIIL